MRKILSILLILSIAVLLFGCGDAETKTDAANTTQASTAAQSAETTAYQYYQTNEETYTIETDYVPLYYPKKWKDKVEVKITNSDSYIVSFYGKTESKEVHLFDLYFKGSKGTKLGTFTKDGKNLDVYINSFDIDKSSMSDNEYIELATMQEDVNVIISKMVEKNGLKVNA